MHIVIFCGDKSLISQVADELILGICDSVNAKTSCRKTVIKIEEKNIQIEIRLGDAYSAAGLRPDYVLFYNTTNAFRERWNYIMKGRYRELHSLDELTKLVLMTDKKENNFTRLSIQTVKDALKVFCSTRGIDMGIDDFSDSRPNVIKYVFYHNSGQGLMAIIDYMQVEELDKCIDLIFNKLIERFDLEEDR